MRSFVYTVSDELGLHARPAGLLVKLASTLSSEVLIEKEGKAVGATRLLALMGLGIRCGDRLRIEIKGENEAADEEKIRDFFEKNL